MLNQHVSAVNWGIAKSAAIFYAFADVSNVTCNGLISHGFDSSGGEETKDFGGISGNVFVVRTHESIRKSCFVVIIQNDWQATSGARMKQKCHFVRR